MPGFEPVYRTSLKESDFKSKLGKHYANVVEVGNVGKILKSLEGAYSKVDWDKVDPTEQCKNCMYGPQFDAELVKALKYHDQVVVKGLQKVALMVVKPARTAIMKLQSSNTIDKKYRGCVETVKVDAEKFAKELGAPFAKEIKNYYEMRKAQQAKNIAKASKTLAKYAKTISVAMLKMKKKADGQSEDEDKFATFNEFRTEYIRGVGTALPFFKKDPEFAKLGPFWKKASADGYKCKVAADIDKKVKVLKNEINELVRLMKKNQLL